jgi:methionine-rich copper-binding protein CopC
MSRPSQLATAFIAAPLALALAATAAFAHAQLIKASPAVGGVVKASPSEIRLKFTEGLEPRFSGIVLTGEAGASVPIGKAGVEPGDATTFVAPIPQPLKPGAYTVTWHAVSVDTHKTQGAYQFTVQP